jgi:hypothetical protein
MKRICLFALVCTILLIPKNVYAQSPTIQIISPVYGDMFSDNTIIAEGYAYDYTDYIQTVKVKINGDPDNSSSWYTGYSDTGQHSMSPEWTREIDLDPGKNNMYVKATDNYGNLSPIESNEFWYIAPPVNVNASRGIFEDHVHITWDIWGSNPSYENYYRVYRGLTPDPNDAVEIIDGVTPNQYWDDYNVEPNNTYYYFVKLKCHLVESGFSLYDTGYVVPPPTPQNITLSTDLVNSEIILNWDDAGMYDYKVYSSEEPYNGFQEDLSGTYSTTSWSAPISEYKRFYYVKTISK